MLLCFIHKYIQDFLEGGGADFRPFLGRPKWFSELSQSTTNTLIIRPGTDLGGGMGGRGGGLFLFLRDSTPCRPKVSPFELFSDIQFWLTDPKIFLKALLAPIYTNFKGGMRAKKRNFLVKIFQKVPLFWPDFSKFWAAYIN